MVPDENFKLFLERGELRFEIRFLCSSSAPATARMAELFDLYLAEEWVSPGEGADLTWLMDIISGSALFAVILHQGRIIGMGRAISDGFSDAYIQDVAVLKVFRGLGLGGELISCLVEALSRRGLEWIALVAQPGTESFYRRQGFRPMEGHIPMRFHGPTRANLEEKSIPGI